MIVSSIINIDRSFSRLPFYAYHYSSWSWSFVLLNLWHSPWIHTFTIYYLQRSALEMFLLYNMLLISNIQKTSLWRDKLSYFNCSDSARGYCEDGFFCSLPIVIYSVYISIFRIQYYSANHKNSLWFFSSVDHCLVDAFPKVQLSFS